MTTNQIEIYVRSSPLGKVGIHWRKASEYLQSSQRTETPDILMEEVVPDDDSKLSVNSVINTVKPCLILAKYNGKVFLEVTGIDATPDRSEKLGRRISEVVLWVGDVNPETEAKLRKLAYCALLGLWNPESDFRRDISSSIEFDGLNDYKVKAYVLKDMYERSEKYCELEGDNPSSHNYLEPKEFKTDQEVRQLATQLRDASFDGMETAVVIAEIKQTESERWLNHRGNVAKQPEVTPVIPPIVPVNNPVITSPGDVTGKKLKGKAPELKLRRRSIIAVMTLILLLMILLLMGQKYLGGQEKTIDQEISALKLSSTQLVK